MVGFVAIPTATAEEVTNTASMALTCTATPITSLAGPQTFSAENVSVNVTSPTDVEIGEEFTTPYSIDPVSVEVPSLPLGARLETASRLKLDFALPEDTGRMKYDIRLPQGVAISNLRISGAGVGFNNNPVVQRVNSSGAPPRRQRRVRPHLGRRQLRQQRRQRERQLAAVDLARGLAGGQAQDLTYTRPDVEVEAEVLTGDLIRFIATVDAGDKAIEDGVTTVVLAWIHR